MTEAQTSERVDASDAPPPGPDHELLRLMADIDTAKGVLRIPNPGVDERARLRRIVHRLRASSLLPEGHRIELRGRDKGDVILRLVPDNRPRPASSALEPVPVPEHLEDKKVHRAVRAISLPVCAQCRPRARRMLHALAVAAEITGLKVIAPDDTAPAKAVLTMCAGERRYPLLMSEADEEVPDLGTVKYPWQRVTATKAGPTHELELELAYDWGHRGRRYRWGDRERWKLEDKLPELLHEITQRIGIEKEREADEKRRQTEGRGRWEAAMAEARRRLMEDHRAACLREQARLRSEATSMRAYCDALENRIMRAESVPGEVGEGAKTARAWVDWARSYADKLDPLTGLPGMPEDPDPTPEELRSYLHVWSPYGFDQR